MLRRIFRFFFLLGSLLSLVVIAGVLVVGVYFYFRFTRDLPRIERISDYHPKAVSSIYAEDGTLMAEVYDERRYPVEFSEIPDMVKKAFLAAEDAGFYSHQGIDFLSILRALWVNLHRQQAKQGASTITQQVVKSLLLSREKTYERKAKEAILSYRLEQALTKDEIFSIYLNEIFLGSTAYGVKAAAKVHFHKELKDLTLPEAAFLAGLPQKPSLLADPTHFEEAIRRQHYVLEQMSQNNFINAEQRERALAVPIKVFPPDQNRVFAAPYCFNHVNELLKTDFGNRAFNPGGLKIYTTCDSKAYEMAEHALQRGVREVDKRRGWRGPLSQVQKGQLNDLLDNQALQSKGGLEKEKIYRALVASVDQRSGIARVQVGDYAGVIHLAGEGWAKKLINKNDDSIGIDLGQYIKPGQIIEVSVDEKSFDEHFPKGLAEEDKAKAGGKAAALPKMADLVFHFDQTPELEAAMVVISPLTGEVKVIIGGYDYQRSQFNRATQALRQPGSSFKPIIYLTAIETLNYTPATIVPDSPISLVAGNGKIWTPSNFDRKYLGPITLRTALQQSRNVVSVYLLRRTGVERVIKTARRLGLTTPINPDLSISLGTAEVKLIEMVRAYGVLSAGGWLADQIVIKSIRDRDDNEIYNKHPKQVQVVNEDDAFILANMMKGVVERGTGTVVKALGKPVAGKTGTTNEQMDAWFIGYTPEWAAGVWVGFDVKRKIGRLETGGKAAAPIFLYFMQDFLADKPGLDFDPPDGVVPIPIIPSSGSLAEAGAPGAFIEYFKTGTEPKLKSDDAEAPQDYLSSDEL